MPKRSAADFDKSSDEYRQKRAKNNEAVKKSRQKSRQKESENSELVQRLREENSELEQKADILKKELAFLKDMFVAYASGRNSDGSSSAEEPSSSTTSTNNVPAADSNVSPTKQSKRS